MWTSFKDREDLAWPLVVTASLIVAGTMILRFLWKTYQLSPIPQPESSSLLFGNLFDTLGGVARWRENGAYPEAFLSWVKQYGNAVLLRELFSYSVMFTDPKASQHVLSTNANNYHRTDFVENYLADFTFGPGLLSTRGAVHDGYRKMLNPLFSASQIKSFVPIFEAQARHVCDTILAQARASGEPINLHDVFSDLALRVIGLAGFGYNFEDHPEAHEALYLIPHFFDFPLPSFLRRRKAQRTLKRVVNEVIEQKLAQKDATDKPKDLLDLILLNSTTREAIIHTMTFLSAGHDASTTALDVIQRIREEYKTVIAKHGSLSTWEALSQLTYTLAVVQETMRLSGVLYSLTPRDAVKDDHVPMLDGSSVFIPAGTTIMINTAAFHRHPTYWTNADEFIPERFLEGTPEWDADLKLRDGKSHAFYYLPFSFGSANCIGQWFALAEIQVILAMIIGEFDFKLTSAADLRQKHNGVSMTPAKLEVTIQRVPTAPVPAA
ncbi:hypothetical protein AeMF1_010868 [Aphanomyces euteiches]|nr:hypothetical protein AeMF1_010868 [Aphanomyces euteiches]KAH9131239.1 hypothetical protein AeNC1_019725 [Aphanomyces euteiches]